MKLQISSRLAIYAVLELAGNPDGQMSAAEISEKYNISTHHLAKVLHTLGRAGLVRSVRGARGGYQFSGNAKRTTLMELIELFENVGGSDNGNAEAGEDSEVGKALGQVLQEIDDLSRATFSSITLSTMLKLMQR